MRISDWSSDVCSSDLPLASDQSLGMDERSEPTGALSLLQLSGSVGAVDHDENITGYALVTNAAQGTVTLDTTTGAWVYQPATYYHGPDSFVIEVNEERKSVG